MEKLAVLKRNAWPGNRLRLGADFWARVSWPMIKSSAGPADLMVKPRWNLVFREKKENAEISLFFFRLLLAVEKRFTHKCTKINARTRRAFYFKAFIAENASWWGWLMAVGCWTVGIAVQFRELKCLQHVLERSHSSKTNIPIDLSRCWPISHPLPVPQVRHLLASPNTHSRTPIWPQLDTHPRAL